MKTKTLFNFIFAAVILIGCSNNQSDENTANDAKNVPDVEQDILVNDSVDAELPTESNNENWDQMLDDYESYVTEYVSLYKKAMKGDADALSAYPELLEKAENLQNSMQEAEKNKSLSSSQLKRMAKIQLKMLEAIQSN